MALRAELNGQEEEAAELQWKLGFVVTLGSVTFSGNTLCGAFCCSVSESVTAWRWAPLAMPAALFVVVGRRLTING